MWDRSSSILPSAVEAPSIGMTEPTRRRELPGSCGVEWDERTGELIRYVGGVFWVIHACGDFIPMRRTRARDPEGARFGILTLGADRARNLASPVGGSWLPLPCCAWNSPGFICDDMIDVSACLLGDRTRHSFPVCLEQMLPQASLKRNP